VDPVSLLMIVAAAAGFYFLIIRPNKKRQQAARDMRSGLEPGAEIMTTAGIFGTVAVVTDDEISLEISPGVFLRILPAAVAKVVEPAPASIEAGAIADAADRPADEPPVD
jgi:preprotein translocase subunit YajC